MVSVDGRQLPLTAVALRVEAQGGIARVTLTQHFRNPHEDPLQVTYRVPLPEDAAVAGYAFRLGGRRIAGVVEKLQDAKERFEKALVSGRTAALLTQERTSLFTQELGNVPPGGHVTVELTLDQRLRWCSEGLWEWRFPTVAAPRYTGERGLTPDGDRLAVDVADCPTGIHATLELAIGDSLAPGRQPESPSHPVRFTPSPDATRARLEEGVPLDRDLVVRWPVATPEPGVRLHVARQEGRLEASAFGLLTLVPPSVAGARLPRDLIFLLDVSGSMEGRPLEHARRVAASLIDTLEAQDSLEVLAFSNTVHRWRELPAPADAAARRDAVAWVMGLRATGGTQMHDGIREALRPLRPGSQRQVVLVTDGLIGFEQEVVRLLSQHLPRQSRLHTVGVGPSVNRSLTHAAARAGRGVEVLTGLEEDVERATARLIAATRAPVLVDVTVEGEAVEDAAPSTVTDLMAGAPVLLSLKLRPEGGALTVRGHTPAGPWEQHLTVPPVRTGEGSPALASLYAREKVEDLTLLRSTGAPRGDLEARIERLGLEYQVATALTAWVAVSDTPTVDPAAPTRYERVPQLLPLGMSAQGLGLSGAAGVSRPLIQVRRVMPSVEQGSPIREFRAVPPAQGARPSRKPESSKHEVEGPVSLNGRRLASDDQLTTVELQCDTMLWDPAVTFEAELEDGTRATLRVELEGCTRRGRVVRGQRVRLCFRTLPHRVVGLHWSFDGVEYAVTLR